MKFSKLYSVWIDGKPSSVLSSYHDDIEAIAAFSHLLLTVRSDIENGIIEAGTDSQMSLYAHGRFLDDGSVRGFLQPIHVIDADDLQPPCDGECEVVE